MSTDSNDTGVFTPVALPRPFGELIRRAVQVANATPSAIPFVLLLIGPQQIVGGVAAAVIAPDGNVPQFKPGNPFQTELLLLMLLGVGNCGWFFVELFGLPWVFGGAGGQLRDRLLRTDGSAGRFSDYGKRYYGAMLGIFALTIAALIGAYVPVFGGTMALMASQGINFFAVHQERVQELSRHPAAIAISFAYLLAAVAIGTVAGLANAVAVVDGRGPIESIAAAFSFLRRRAADAAKLYGVGLALVLPVVLPTQIGNLLGAGGAVWLIGVSLVVAVYLSYATVVNLAVAVTLYLDRTGWPVLTSTSGPASGS